ncbi:MAG: hypothetical protein EBY78_07665 [Actinobacteria bacterium]|jgi:hypothetical protein|nr:hypothetical protein [Actinomycetota bacterium]
MTVLIGPSEKQVDFILTLLKEREIEAGEADELRENLPHLNKREASDLIARLLKLPKLPKAPRVNPTQVPLTTIQKSKYALPVADLSHLDLGFEIHGDLLFLEVREFMGTLYMRRLTGSLGGFTRHKLSVQDVIDLVGVIRSNQYGYAKLFGIHYSCCGSCGAELTDPTSRSLQLGPECRKKFGF